MKGTMKLVSPEAGLMKCQVCGSLHSGQIRPGSGGKLYQKNWKCRFGCKREEVTQKK